MRFGNIPYDILNILIPTYDGDEVRLETLIKEETSDDINYAIWSLDTTDPYCQLSSFKAFTETDTLLLIRDRLGYYLARFDRNASMGGQTRKHPNSSS
jgi:hypothetical protein